MGSVDKFKDIFSKCDLCIDGNVISKELILQTFAKFLDETIDKKEHNIGAVLHTGSVCFDAVMLACAAFYNIFHSESLPMNIIDSLEPGDMVLYYDRNNRPKKYIFKGFKDRLNDNDDRFIWLESKPGDSSYIPKACWSKIVPYCGTSTRLDGRGLRKESGKYEHFCKFVLGIEETTIQSLVNLSSVVVISREHANELIPRISFKFLDTNIKLIELIPVSYYTEGDMYQFGFNQAKREPILKLTGKMSVARKLLLSREGNKKIGLIVLGEENIRSGEYELPELLDRQSIKYIYLVASIDSEFMFNLLTNYVEASVFACTKDFLLSNSLPVIKENFFTKRLSKEIDLIIDHEVLNIQLKGFISKDEYYDFKRFLYIIKAADYDSKDKENFIVQAYALMNIYMTAPFSIIEFDKAIKDKVIVSGIASIAERKEIIESSMLSFPQYIKEIAEKAIKILQKASLRIMDVSQKKLCLIDLLAKSQVKETTIVVPKAYYSTLVKKLVPYKMNVEIITANRFDHSKNYEQVIVLGNISGSRFNIFRCQTIQKVIVLLYECEVYNFRKNKRKFTLMEELYNSRSAIEIGFDDDIEEDVEELEEISEINDELEEFVNTSILRLSKYENSYDSKSVQADIVAIARLTGGNVAFFSKNYKAYILKSETKSAIEIKALDLAEGDTIVFTRSNTKTRDIVENLLLQLVKDKAVPLEIENAYVLSQKWKTVLIDYMKSSGKTPKQIAAIMIAHGTTVQEITIRNWLEEDSHIVGPRKLDSLKQIAMLTNDVYLKNHAEDCFNACSVIRGVRRKILDAIARAILGGLSKEDMKDTFLRYIQGSITELSTVLTIKSIVFVNDQISINMVNRPLMLKCEME